MSNFPFNRQQYIPPTESINGTPLTYREAWALADKIRKWHGDHNTDDWSQSNDSAEEDITNLAFGFLDLFSDPYAMRRLMMSGERVKNNVRMVRASNHGMWDQINTMLDGIFK